MKCIKAQCYSIYMGEGRNVENHIIDIGCYQQSAECVIFASRFSSDKIYLHDFFVQVTSQDVSSV